MVGDRFSSFASKIGASIRSRLDRSSGSVPGSNIGRYESEQQLEEGRSDDTPALPEGENIRNEGEEINEESKENNDEEGKEDTNEPKMAKEIAELGAAENVARMVASRESGYVYIQTKSKRKWISIFHRR